jgi:HEAT repeat protein
MRNTTLFPRRFWSAAAGRRTPKIMPAVRTAAALLLGLAGLATPSRAQSRGDPIYELQQALVVRQSERDDLPTLLNREKTLQKIVQRLHTVRELRSALTLTGWQDQVDEGQQAIDRSSRRGDLNERLIAIDRAARKEVGDRLEKRIEEDARRGDATNRLAIASMLETMGTSVRALGDPVIWQGNIPGLHPGLRQDFGFDAARAAKYPLPDWRGYARRFTPLLVKFTRDPSPQVRLVAARALGKINPDLKETAPALKGMLQKGTVPERRAAAEGLLSMMREINVLQKKGRTQSGVEAKVEEVLDVATAVTPVAGLGIDDSDPLVRRLCLSTLLDSAASLSILIPEPFSAKEVPPRNEPLTPPQIKLVRAKAEEIKENEEALAPLTKALAAQADHLAREANDADPQARLLAMRVLEYLAQSRQRMKRRWESLPDVGREPRPGASAQLTGSAPGSGLVLVSAQQAQKPGNAVPKVQVKDASNEGLLLRSVNPSLKNIARQMKDPNPVNRRAAIDFLEMLEEGAAPAVPALIGALSDPDVFVRWSAARTLGRINVEAAAAAVPALARAVSDRDLDVRLTAAATLEAYGSAARAAIPALTEAVTRGDPDVRRAVMYALQAIGPAASQAATPKLLAALRNEDAKVRRTAAETLGSFGPAARNAVPALRRALQDEDADVRQAASDALLSIMPPPG